MGLLRWVKFDLAWIIERFLELIHEHYWLSVLLLWVAMAIAAAYAASILVTAARTVRALLVRFRSWYAPLLAAIACVLLFGASMTVTAYLGGARLPVPSLSDLKVVLGEDAMLRWELPAGSSDSAELKFHVQWSSDPNFPTAQSGIDVVQDTLYPLDAARNETLYWRVRALDLDPSTNVPQRFGAWSAPVRIEQYANVVEKIRRTRRITVAMEREFGRSKFRWYELGMEEKRGGEIIEKAVSYWGVDIEIAYAIAGQACRELFEGQIEDGKPMTCLPSRPSQSPPPALCKERKCVRVDVRFVPVPWSDVLRSVGEGRQDMAISSITYVPGREYAYNLLFSTRSYEQTRYGIVSRRGAGTPAGERRGAVSPDELRHKRIGVQPETTAYACISHVQRTLAKDGERRAFDIVERISDLRAINDLVRGQVAFDLLVTDGTTAEGWKELHGDSIVVEETPANFFGADAPEFCRDQDYRVAVRAGEFELQGLVDRLLERTELLASIRQRTAEAYSRFLHGFKVKAASVR